MKDENYVMLILFGTFALIVLAYIYAIVNCWEWLPVSSLPAKCFNIIN